MHTFSSSCCQSKRVESRGELNCLKINKWFMHPCSKCRSWHKEKKSKCSLLYYHKTSGISRTKYHILNVLVASCSCLRPFQWSQLLSWEWRCSWSSADRRCSNYIWVINNFIAYQGATYIRGFTVLPLLKVDRDLHSMSEAIFADLSTIDIPCTNCLCASPGALIKACTGGSDDEEQVGACL